MAVHHFRSRETLLEFWRQRRGYLLNNFKNCLHETGCDNYRYNPPGMSYTRMGFDTPEDVLAQIGRQDQGWYSCPTCNPHLSIGAAQSPSTRAHLAEASPSRSGDPATRAATHVARQSAGADLGQVIAVIREVGRRAPRFSTGLTEADDLVYSNPFAFLLACSLDRGARSENIWRIPYFIQRDLGHLDPSRLAAMNSEDARALLERLPTRPRYLGDAVDTIREVAILVAGTFEGQAERIWIGQPVRRVLATLLAIRGIGPGIAHMTINLLHRYGLAEFDPGDLRDIDVKPDVHVERVFMRSRVGGQRVVDMLSGEQLPRIC
jgi:hypothetical protein